MINVHDNYLSVTSTTSTLMYEVSGGVPLSGSYIVPDGVLSQYIVLVIMFDVNIDIFVIITQYLKFLMQKMNLKESCNEGSSYYNY